MGNDSIYCPFCGEENIPSAVAGAILVIVLPLILFVIFKIFWNGDPSIAIGFGLACLLPCVKFIKNNKVYIIACFIASAFVYYGVYHVDTPTMKQCPKALLLGFPLGALMIGLSKFWSKE